MTNVALILKASVGPMTREDTSALQAISLAFLTALVPMSAAADFGRDHVGERERGGFRQRPGLGRASFKARDSASKMRVNAFMARIQDGWSAGFRPT